MAQAFVADTQVLDGLCDFLNTNFTFSNFGMSKIELEQTSAKSPSCGIFAETGSFKDVINIIGDWDCNFRFRIDFKADGNSTKKRVNFSVFFDELAKFFEQKTASGLSGLSIGTNRKPIKCEMITVPAKVSVDTENVQVFSAFFNLLYNEKRSI